MISEVVGERYYFSYWAGEWVCSCDKEILRCLGVAALMIGRGGVIRRGHVTRSRKEGGDFSHKYDASVILPADLRLDRCWPPIPLAIS